MLFSIAPGFSWLAVAPPVKVGVQAGSAASSENAVCGQRHG